MHSRFPVGQEWRFAVEWGSPEAFNKANYELYQSAIGVCMTKRGFSYQPVTYIDDDILYVYVNPLNTLIADEWGYHTPPILDSLDEHKLSSSEAEAIDGDGGCGRTAYEFVFGNPVIAGFFEDFNKAVGVVSGKIAGWETSPAGTTSIAGWNACMKQAGFDYKDPESASTRFSGSPSVTEEELRVRKADISCDKEAHLTENRSAYERQHLVDWLDENAEFAQTLTDELAAAEHAEASLQELLSTQGLKAFG